MGVEDGLCVVEGYEHRRGGKDGAQGCQIFRVFDICSDDYGEAGEEVRERWRELVATNKSTIISESLFDAIVVEDREGDGRLPGPSCTNQGNGFQILSQSNDLFNQFISTETDPWRRGRQFSSGGAVGTLDDVVPSIPVATDLTWL